MPGSRGEAWSTFIQTDDKRVNHCCQSQSEHRKLAIYTVTTDLPIQPFIIIAADSAAMEDPPRGVEKNNGWD